MSTTFVAAGGLETAPIQDGSVLYHPKSGRYVLLNRTAAFLLTQLSTPRTEDELVRLLGTAFPGIDSVGPDVSDALEAFSGMELVVPDGSASAAPASPGNGNGDQARPDGYERPSIRTLDEDELLKIFQMTAAEISVASCWWIACPSG